MTDGEKKKNCSAYTVIVYEEKDEIKVANTIDYYIERGKSYEDIKTKLPERPGWRAIQSKELYQVVKMLEKEKRSMKCAADYFERIQDISNELNNLVNDTEEDL